MIHQFRRLTVAVAIVTALAIVSSSRGARGANPSAEQALRLTPIQDEVDYDRPSPEEAVRRRDGSSAMSPRRLAKAK